MSEAAQSPPRDPLLRFRLRTVIALTTGLALAAAVAAPYFRRQSPEAQSNLLLFWTISLVFVGAGIAWRLRLVSRVPAAAGPIHFWVTLRWPWRFHARVQPLLLFAFLAIAIFITVMESRAVVHQAQMTKELNWVTCFLAAAIVGLILSGTAVAMTAPIALCERGIPIYGTVTGWRLIRDAGWEPARRSVLKLRGVNGDIFVEVPVADRERVEAYVRERINAANAVSDTIAPGH